LTGGGLYLHAQNSSITQAIAQNDGEQYPFKPGDGLNISTLPDTTSIIHRVFSIDDQGYVDFPIVGRVKVSEMKKGELIKFLNTNFRLYIRSEHISVTPMARVSILGGVFRPGLYYVDYHSTLWDVVKTAGGTVHEKGIRELRWERNRNDVVKDLIPYFEKGISLETMGFKSGDQLWTPGIHKGFWNIFTTDIIPLVTFATSMAFLYISYQQTIYSMQYYGGRR
jgi:protein involved in polysaccharide export with SLBB domain